MRTHDQIIDLIEFMDNSPSPWQATAQLSHRLLEAGFAELKESDPWNVKPGQKYFTIRNGSTLCAFITPTGNAEAIKMMGAHTDSPGFKLKPNPEYRHHNCVMFGVEVYGSPLLTSWLNRDLGIAGRINVLNEQDEIDEHHVMIDDHPVTIPQLAIHLDREVNSKGLVLNKQKHTSAIAALESVPSGHYFEKLLREQRSFKTLLGHDLFLYPLDRARFLGEDGELLSSYRLDNLAGVHAGTAALIEQEASEDVFKMAVFWDNEEVGSATPQGAESPFALNILERVIDRNHLLRILPGSTCVSVDLAHAIHPNYPEMHEPNHAPRLQNGVVIKYHAQQRYASDARSVAKLKSVAQKHNIPIQDFVVRSDIPCGSTIGPLHAKGTGMPTVDIGIPQLSMHAARELIACRDHIYMIDLLTHFWI